MTEAKPQPDEQLLIERARSGDREAQEELFQRHATGLHAWVRLKRSDLIKDNESSLDIVQSVFHQALRDLRRFDYRGPGGFRNWLLTYANNKLRDRDRYYRALCRTSDARADASLSQLYATICSPSRAMDIRESVAAFERAFGELAERDQQIILMARVEGFTHAHIADACGISEAASKQALRRALVRLASRMTE